jgi:hypothetical protein
MESQLPALLDKIVDSSPWIGGVVILTILWRKEILAFFMKLRPEDDLVKSLGTIANKQDRVIELLEVVATNSQNNGTTLAVLTALVQRL